MSYPGPFGLAPEHEARLPPARSGARGVQVLCGVPYAAMPGIRPLELDLFLPPEHLSRPVPAVVFLHGGGWRLGSRRSAGPAYAGTPVPPFERIAQAGVAVASLDYRLSGEATWPAQLHDVKAAVRWLRARASDVGVDTARIAAWGESAGGHLAELLGLTADMPELEGNVGVCGPSSAVAAVVAWYAPSDLRALADDNGAERMDSASREAQLLGAAVPTVPAVAAQASPITYAASGAPPFLLLHGGTDQLIPCVQSERLRAALVAAGVDVELEIFDGAGHMWMGSGTAAGLALDRTITELRRRLNIPASPASAPAP